MFDWDQKLARIQQDERIAGLAVAVTDREKIVYSRGFGAESVERPGVAPDELSLHRVASITKIVSGLTLLRLVEEGRLELDRPVKDYIPWLTLTNREAYDTMTLRHLLAHTAGLPVEYTPNGPREESSLEQVLMEALPTLEFATVPSDGVHLYSNWGVRIGSYMAQRVTGKFFTELCQEYVLDPLGMTCSTFDLRCAATYSISKPHVDGENGELEVFHYIKENAARMASGGLYSNCRDLCKLGRYLMNRKSDSGQKLLCDSLLDEMFRPHAVMDPSLPSHYGLTMFVRPFGERILRGHTGSAPPYGSVLLTEAQSGYGVVALLNTQRDHMRLKIAEMLLSDLINS